MSKHRDYISEILSRKSRHLKRAQRWEQFIKRAEPLVEAFTYAKDQIKSDVPFRAELLRYFPIGMVACLEGYFRMAFRDLIDFGEPYIENVKNFKDISLGMPYVLAIHGKKITIGEFIAHLLPISNLEDINRDMSVIIGQDFLERLNTTEYDLKSRTSSLDRLKVSAYGDIKEIFRLRHIFCHELAITERIKIRSLESALGGVALFTYATEAMMRELLDRRT
ncbi:MAG TPA: hypothetical protein VM911_08720 [Pyrinomonadaceae bacterium]|jgi:hypothetical protein|nr:hypothetical protein [Pyrinomonadaceae bacterium]